MGYRGFCVQESLGVTVLQPPEDSRPHADGADKMNAHLKKMAFR